jgi:outer membrane cobalamin receptor
MSKRFFTLVALLSSSLAACAPPPAYNAYDNDRSVIRFPEIQRTYAGSALDLIRKTRPNFLFARGLTTLRGNSSGLPTVYVDGMRYGTISTLDDIPASNIAEIKLYRAGESAQFGMGNAGGVLMIRTRRR